MRQKVRPEEEANFEHRDLGGATWISRLAGSVTCSGVKCQQPTGGLHRLRKLTISDTSIDPGHRITSICSERLVTPVLVVCRLGASCGVGAKILDPHLVTSRISVAFV